MSVPGLAANCEVTDADPHMAETAEGASPLRSGLANALADGYATVHELETRRMQLERHCEALVAAAADGAQIRAVMRARRALGYELDDLRDRLEQLQRASA
jgi:hypothetical protein